MLWGSSMKRMEKRGANREFGFCTATALHLSLPDAGQVQRGVLGGDSDGNLTCRPKRCTIRGEELMAPFVPAPGRSVNFQDS